jgi:hypothetical protein
MREGGHTVMSTQAQPQFGIESRFADVNGTRLHYLALQAQPCEIPG